MLVLRPSDTGFRVNWLEAGGLLTTGLLELAIESATFAAGVGSIGGGDWSLTNSTDDESTGPVSSGGNVSGGVETIVFGKGSALLPSSEVVCKCSAAGAPPSFDLHNVTITPNQS
jgi:hypothetical protein